MSSNVRFYSQSIDRCLCLCPLAAMRERSEAVSETIDGGVA